MEEKLREFLNKEHNNYYKYFEKHIKYFEDSIINKTNTIIEPEIIDTYNIDKLVELQDLDIIINGIKDIFFKLKLISYGDTVVYPSIKKL